MRDDARRFFYSVPTDAVQNMWQHFFRFPPDVACILTDLTTYKGFLPPGAQTSSDIASLIFWDREPQLEFTLRSLGYTYSRYVDDITVSSSEWVEISNLSEVKSLVYGMLRSLGIKQNRKKSRKAIVTSGHSQRVHNIVVNKTTLSLPKSLRRAVREEIAQLGKMEPENRGTIQYLEAFERAMGRAAHIEQFHQNEGRRLKAELQKIKPTIKRPSTRRDTVGVH